MRTRYKSPTGNGILTISDEATVTELFAEVRSQTGIPNFALKYGWPLQTLDVSLGDTPASLLGLHGATLIVEPVETNVPSTHGDKPPARAEPSAPPPPNTEPPEDIAVAWPERQGTLLLRVMPSDNSCLFTAFSGAFPDQLPAAQLRAKVAEFILAHPDEYNETILGMKPSQYCRKIQTPNYWGGAIEISIFSFLFDIEICTFDVKEKTLLRFGESKQSRCILVYSGIHYDRVAFSPSEPPYLSSQLPPEVDCTIWSTSDEEILAQTQVLVEKLHAVHYYTDPSQILLRCEVSGCGWIGSGESAGQRHARETGHVRLGEIDDAVLLRCKVSGCEWLGGVGDAKKHGVETGHVSLAYIPDL